MTWRNQPWGAWLQILAGCWFCRDAPEWVVGVGLFIGANMSYLHWLLKRR